MNTRMELLKRYLTEDPSDSFLRYALALELIALNDHNGAYGHLTKLINDDPEYLAAYYITGKTAEALNKNIEAIKFYSKGIEVAGKQKNQHTLSELNAALENLE
jgi:tetratricopeptide (TPR) repeat protein